MPSVISQKLPDDILVELLRGIDSGKTLSALSLCSRQLHQFCEPYLPSLAKYVKRFTANALLGYCTDISMGMINEDDWGNIKSELKKITYTSRGERCSPFTEKIESNFLPMIEAGNWDALVGLLVSLLPNLEEINIVNHASGCPYGYPYLETVLLRAAALQCTSTYEPYALSKLHTVRLAKHDAIHHPRMGFEFLRIFPFLSLPSVRNVRGHMISDFHYSPAREPHRHYTLSTLYTYPLPQFAFNITSLTLTHTVMRSESLPTFLSYFKSLQHFSWDFQYDLQNGDRENMHFDLKPSVLAASIQHLSQTLQTLRITQKRLRQPPKLHTNDGQSSFPPLSSLSNFTQLEVLDVSAHLVFGDDETISSDGYLEALSRLPDSVQTLVLRDSVRDNDISATSQLFYPDIFVKTIVGDWNGWRRPKGLQSMELHFRKSARNESTILRWEEYEDLCRKLGLNLRRGEDRGAVRNHHGESQGEQHDVGCDDCDAHKKLGKIQMERSDDWMTTIAITEEPGMQEVTNAGKPNLMPRTTTAS
ncbi:hypothetical protein ACMFMG_002252 [Clarireedia jacksonii]